MGVYSSNSQNNIGVYSQKSYSHGKIFVFPDVDISKALKEVDWIKIYDLIE